MVAVLPGPGWMYKICRLPSCSVCESNFALAAAILFSTHCAAAVLLLSGIETFVTLVAFAFVCDEIDEGENNTDGDIEFDPGGVISCVSFPGIASTGNKSALPFDA